MKFLFCLIIACILFSCENISEDNNSRTLDTGIKQNYYNDDTILPDIELEGPSTAYINKKVRFNADYNYSGFKYVWSVENLSSFQSVYYIYRYNHEVDIKFLNAGKYRIKLKILYEGSYQTTKTKEVLVKNPYTY